MPRSRLCTTGMAPSLSDVDHGDKVDRTGTWSEGAAAGVIHGACLIWRRGASAAAVVYDITNAESFQKAKHWVSELQKNASGNIGAQLFLVNLV